MYTDHEYITMHTLLHFGIRSSAYATVTITDDDFLTVHLMSPATLCLKERVKWSSS